MHLTYINITTLSIDHINNISTTSHKATTTQDIRGSPQCGATSTNSSSSSLLASSNLLTCTEPQSQLRIGQEICVHLARSSFPELGPSTKPYTVCAQSHLQSLALSSASLNTQYAQSRLQILALSHTHPLLLLTFLSSLFIHYKRGLSMGKPMGRHPIPVT
jgi:hypothetical protein